MAHFMSDDLLFSVDRVVLKKEKMRQQLLAWKPAQDELDQDHSKLEDFYQEQKASLESKRKELEQFYVKSNKKLLGARPLAKKSDKLERRYKKEQVEVHSSKEDNKKYFAEKKGEMDKSKKRYNYLKERAAKMKIGQNEKIQAQLKRLDRLHRVNITRLTKKLGKVIGREHDILRKQKRDENNYQDNKIVFGEEICKRTFIDYSKIRCVKMFNQKPTEDILPIGNIKLPIFGTGCDKDGALNSFDENEPDCDNDGSLNNFDNDDDCDNDGALNNFGNSDKNSMSSINQPEAPECDKDGALNFL